MQNYKKAISIDPKNIDALNNLSVAYKKLGQLEMAKSVLNQALKMNANHAGTHYNLVVLYEETGNLESAIHFYKKFWRLGMANHPLLVQKVEKHIQTLK
ncbi:MAG: tetratricopeptide repeat protein [Nitrospinae bacterium]|nr:tetratricopeptide repeat protein [Nitrospinota bacterium]